MVIAISPARTLCATSGMQTIVWKLSLNACLLQVRNVLESHMVYITQ